MNGLKRQMTKNRKIKVKKEKKEMKNILVISSSIRNGSNSELLAKRFTEGALSSGNHVDFVSLKGKNIQFCLGCLSCQKTGKCVLQDAANEIVEKMAKADVIVFATPIYYYEMSGQMKTLLDRANPLYDASERKFHDIYFIATCADEDKHALDRAIQGLQGWIVCFDEVSLKGVIYGTCVNDPQEVSTQKDLLEQAFQMGQSIA